MGCWNSICILSNLSISYGQRVVVFPIWNRQLCLFPIRGQYNDYGSIENADTHPLQEVLFDKLEASRISFDEIDSFNSNIDDLKAELKAAKEAGKSCDRDTLKMELGLMKKTATAISREGRYTSLNDLVDDMERQIIRGEKIASYDSFRGSFNGLEFCMVLESVWDEIRDMYLADTDVNYRHPHCHINDQLKSFNSKDEDMTDNEEHDAMIMKYAIMSLTSGLSNYYDDYSRIMQFDVDMYNAGLLDDYVEVVKEMSDFRSVMTVMRKELNTDPGAGMQLENHKFMQKSYEIFANSVEVEDE